MNHAISANRARLVRAPTFLQRTWLIFKAWLGNPTQVATLCPSSPYLNEHLADRDSIRHAGRIIELGPGAGGTTQALLAHMRPDAKLLSIEKTAVFSEALDAIQDPRLRVEFADAIDLLDMVLKDDFGQADVLVSGIPFSSIPAPVAITIVQTIYEVLRPGGVFIAYQFRSDVKNYARPLFGPATTELIPMNLPPLTAFVWTKTV